MSNSDITVKQLMELFDAEIERKYKDGLTKLAYGYENEKDKCLNAIYYLANHLLPTDIATKVKLYEATGNPMSCGKNLED